MAVFAVFLVSVFAVFYFTVNKYLERGEIFTLYDDDLKSICVITEENPGTCEIKNIATYEKWHGKGYGSKLIQHVSAYFKK